MSLDCFSADLLCHQPPGTFGAKITIPKKIMKNWISLLESIFGAIFGAVSGWVEWIIWKLKAKAKQKRTELTLK